MVKNNDTSEQSTENDNNVETLVIKLDQIQMTLERIFATCRDRGLSEIAVGHFQYWQIDPEEAFKLGFPEPQFMVGDLFDDAQVILNFERIQPGLLGHHLVNIGALLQYIGSQYPSLALVEEEK